MRTESALPFVVYWKSTNTVCKDPAGLENALRAGLANSLKVQPKPAETDVTAETQATTETTAAPAAKTPAPEDFDAVYIAPMAEKSLPGQSVACRIR